MSFLSKLKLRAGLIKIGVFHKIHRVLNSSKKIDDYLIEEIEEILISGDVGVKTSRKIIETLRARVKRDRFENPDEIYHFLKDEIGKILDRVQTVEKEREKPHVILVVGVNGVGKTTSIGKISKRFLEEGKSVLLVAADTFRAAASEQLSIWAERNAIDIVKHKEGSDPSAVAFDGVNAGIARRIDIVIIDTAGRLHNKSHLMDQLSKMRRVIQKVIPSAPHETMLVLDATMGQNAINQAKSFQKISEIDSIILAKLDGTAKGGVVIGISDELQIPIKYVGIGEGIDDLGKFDSKVFVEGIFA